MPEHGDGYETPPDGFEIAPVVYTCPGCGETVQAIPAETPRMLTCPACEERFVIAAIDGSTEFPEPPQPTEQEWDDRAAAELDSLRMRHLIVTRRTAMRSRTYNILGVAACLMGAAKLGIMTVSEVRVVGWHLRQVSFVLFGLAALMAVGFFWRRAQYWAEQSRGAKMADPETPPDFSALSDGSQHAKNLENLR